MACGCKNKAAKASVSTNVVKSAPVQESKPQKTTNGARIIRREIK